MYTACSQASSPHNLPSELHVPLQLFRISEDLRSDHIELRPCLMYVASLSPKAEDHFHLIEHSICIGFGFDENVTVKNLLAYTLTLLPIGICSTFLDCKCHVLPDCLNVLRLGHEASTCKVKGVVMRRRTARLRRGIVISMSECLECVAIQVKFNLQQTQNFFTCY